MTASGSFNLNHDNKISIFKLNYVMDELFIKRKLVIDEAHGKAKGVIVCKTIVQKGNEFIFSAGGSDDKRVRIWNADSGQCLFEYFFKEPIYDLNFLVFSENEDLFFTNEDVRILICSVLL